MSLMFPKNPAFRDRKWLDYLRQQPCILTHATECVDPAHIRWGLGGGTGYKPPDNRVLPLRHDLHALQDVWGEVPVWREYLTDEVMMRALIALAEKMYREWRAA